MADEVEQTELPASNDNPKLQIDSSGPAVDKDASFGERRADDISIAGNDVKATAAEGSERRAGDGQPDSPKTRPGEPTLDAAGADAHRGTATATPDPATRREDGIFENGLRKGPLKEPVPENDRGSLVGGGESQRSPENKERTNSQTDSSGLNGAAAPVSNGLAGSASGSAESSAAFEAKETAPHLPNSSDHRESRAGQSWQQAGTAAECERGNHAVEDGGGKQAELDGDGKEHRKHGTASLPELERDDEEPTDARSGHDSGDAGDGCHDSAPPASPGLASEQAGAERDGAEHSGTAKGPEVEAEAEAVGEGRESAERRGVGEGEKKTREADTLTAAALASEHTTPEVKPACGSTAERPPAAPMALDAEERGGRRDRGGGGGPAHVHVHVPGLKVLPLRKHVYREGVRTHLSAGGKFEAFTVDCNGHLTALNSTTGELVRGGGEVEEVAEVPLRLSEDMVSFNSVPASKPEGEEGCTCKKSKCVRLYCKCFRAAVLCDDTCRCSECCNDGVHEEARVASVRAILHQNPNAFSSKVVQLQPAGPAAAEATKHHIRGCRCKHSRCLKRYCECFELGVDCSANCECVDCRNFKGAATNPAPRPGSLPRTSRQPLSFSSAAAAVVRGPPPPLAGMSGMLPPHASAPPHYMPHPHPMPFPPPPLFHPAFSPAPGMPGGGMAAHKPNSSEEARFIVGSRKRQADDGDRGKGRPRRVEVPEEDLDELRAFLTEEGVEEALYALVEFGGVSRVRDVFALSKDDIEEMKSSKALPMRPAGKLRRLLEHGPKNKNWICAEDGEGATAHELHELRAFLEGEGLSDILFTLVKRAGVKKIEHIWLMGLDGIDELKLPIVQARLLKRLWKQHAPANVSKATDADPPAATPKRARTAAAAIRPDVVQQQALEFVLHMGLIRSFPEINKLDCFPGEPFRLTPLMRAIGQVHAEGVMRLLEARADVNAANDHGGTALMCATEMGQVGTVRTLLDSRANPNAQRQEGWTALMFAAGFGFEDVVATLCAARADPRLKDQQGFAAVNFAEQQGRISVVHMLHKATREFAGGHKLGAK